MFEFLATNSTHPIELDDTAKTTEQQDKCQVGTKVQMDEENQNGHTLKLLQKGNIQWLNWPGYGGKQGGNAGVFGGSAVLAH